MFIYLEFYGGGDYMGQKSFNNFGNFYSMDESSSIDEVFLRCFFSFFIFINFDQ